MFEFSHFNQILLSLFDVSNIFYDNIWIVYTVWHNLALILVKNVFKTSNKFKKIWLKWLNSNNYRIERLNWIKILKMN